MIMRYGIDTTTFCEHGLNPSGMHKQKQWAERMAEQLENKRTRITWNRNEQSKEKLLWGGTGLIVIGTNTQRVPDFGEDPTQLGRWNWVRTRGLSGIIVRIVSIYIPVNNSGLLSVSAQQRRFFDREKRPGCITEIWWADLNDCIKKWYDDGEQLIISDDINSNVISQESRSFFNKFNMTEAINNKHSNTAETCKKIDKEYRLMEYGLHLQ